MKFYSIEEAVIAYNERVVDLHAPVTLRFKGEMIDTTLGRIIFNQYVPEQLGFINMLLTKKSLRDIIGRVLKEAGVARTAQFLDDIKNLGYYMAFRGGLSFNLDDVIIPEEKAAIVDKGYAKVDAIMSDYGMGLITNNERYNQVVDVWTTVNIELTNTLMNRLKNDDQGFNSVYMMLDSGARGSKDQIRQLCGIRGLMAKPQKAGSTSNEIIENPILSNFKEGLSVLEYFISTHGARKGLADTALKTADAGYLTRRLVDVSQDVIVTQDDCGTLRGLLTTYSKSNEQSEEDARREFSDKLLGRVSTHNIVDPHTEELIAPAGVELTEEICEKINAAKINQVEIRSVLTCESTRGVCAKCYGRNLATASMVQKGEAVGIISAQSIGEPGTQLTLRTFHMGGTASATKEESKIVASKEGFIRYYNLKVFKNQEGKNIVANRRNAAVLIVEPKIKALFKGTIKIENLHDEFLVTLRSKTEEKSYHIRKQYVAKPNELAGVGAKVEGKLYLPYKNGDIVEEGDSIVEVIKEGYNVPNRVSYGAHLKVENSSAVAMKIYAKDSGTIKYYFLKGDYLERMHDVKEGYEVTDKGLFAVIADSEDREASRTYIVRGSIVKISDNIQIKKGDTIAVPKVDEQTVIAEWDSYSTPIIAETDGVIKLEDIIPGITATEKIDEFTGQSRLVINEYIPAETKPSIVLIGADGTILKYSVESGSYIDVQDGQKVKLAAVLARSPKAVIKSKDITGGLPRVNELFEARKPKDVSRIASVSGVVDYGKPIRGKQRIIITPDFGDPVEYQIDKERQLLVKAGEFVHVGEQLTDGILSGHDILSIMGAKSLQQYIISEVQQVYRRQGVEINDKHIEVVVNEMLRQVVIVDSGDTNFTLNDLVSKKRFNEENEKAIAKGLEPAIAEPALLGITKASTSADSVISAASFQETTKVLTEASISGKFDCLEDLKENVVLGRLIPVGTGIYKKNKITLKEVK